MQARRLAPRLAPHVRHLHASATVAGGPVLDSVIDNLSPAVSKFSVRRAVGRACAWLTCRHRMVGVIVRVARMRQQHGVLIFDVVLCLF